MGKDGLYKPGTSFGSQERDLGEGLLKISSSLIDCIVCERPNWGLWRY